jgi:uncharacterized protein
MDAQASLDRSSEMGAAPEDASALASGLQIATGDFMPRMDGDHLLVPVHVVPRAAQQSLELEGGALRVRVLAPPVEGAANEAVIALMATRLRLPRRAVSIRRGARARQKVLAIEGLDVATFWQRLAL